MTRPPVPPARIAAPVVPPHAGSGPLTPAQLRSARVRIAVEMLTQVVEDLDACPAPVRQAACTALVALVDLQAGLRAQEPCAPGADRDAAPVRVPHEVSAPVARHD